MTISAGGFVKKILRYTICLFLSSVVGLAVILFLGPYYFFGCFFQKKRKNRIYSLWSGTPLITLPVLAKAEKLLGVRSTSLAYYTYYSSNCFDYDFSKWFNSSIFFRAFLPYIIFVWAFIKYDRYHYFFDRGLLPNISTFMFNPIELALYKLFNKQLFLYTYGADVRVREITTRLGVFNCCSECNTVGTSCICCAIRSKKNTLSISNNCTAFFAMGDMIEYTPGSRNDLFFWPVDIHNDAGSKYLPSYPKVENRRPVRVVHAPNHRQFKGTHFLVEAIENLQNDNLAIELQLVEKIPNYQALEIYRTADIIFDQCIIGFHGYFALEAMAIGKPVVCYIRKPQEYLLHSDECPIVNCRADQVEDVLRSLCQDRYHLNELGRAGRKYVEKYFTLEAFAQRLKNTYKDIGVL